MTTLVATSEIDDFFAGNAVKAGEDVANAADSGEEPPATIAADAAPETASMEVPSVKKATSAYDPEALIAALAQLGQDIADTQQRGDAQVQRLSDLVGSLVSGKDALGVGEAAKRIEAAADALTGPLRAKLLGGGQDADREISALVRKVTELSKQIERWAAVSSAMTVPATAETPNRFSKIGKSWLIGAGAAAAASLILVGVLVGSVISAVPQSGGALQEEVVALRQQVNLLTTQNARYKVAISEIVGTGNNLAWFYNCPPEKRPRVPNGGQSTLCAFNMTRPFELP